MHVFYVFSGAWRLLPPLQEDQEIWLEARRQVGVRGVLAKPLAQFLNPRGRRYHVRPAWWLRDIPMSSPYRLSKSILLYIPY